MTEKRTGPKQTGRRDVKSGTHTNNKNVQDVNELKTQKLKASTFGERVRLVAERVGGANALATLLGLHAPAISRYMRAEGPTPGGDVLQRIAQVTNCDPGWLLTGAGQPFPTSDPASAQRKANVLSAWDAMVDAVKIDATSVKALRPLLGDDAMRVAAMEKAVEALAQATRQADRT